MELYTLDSSFARKDIVEDDISIIWTERYSTYGETSLVVPATKENALKLTPGTFLSLMDSDEVMLLETANIDEGKLTVDGKSLLYFFNQRVARYTLPHEDKNYDVSAKPANAIKDIVDKMLVTGFPDSGGVGLDTNNLKTTGETMSHLSIDAVTTTYPSVVPITVEYGPVYDMIASIASTYGLGISCYLATPPNIHFKVYEGRDCTSDQSTNPLIRFDQSLDTLQNIKELESIANFKNVCYVFAPGMTTDGTTGYPAGAFPYEPVVVLGPGVDLTTTKDFDRRTMMIWDDDIAKYNPHPEDIDLTYTWWSDSSGVAQEKAQLAGANALANNNFIKVIDGDVILSTEFKFGVNYQMGDLVELRGTNGIIQKAQITEYIRARDESGLKEYPTVSVVN